MSCKRKGACVFPLLEILFFINGYWFSKFIIIDVHSLHNFISTFNSVLCYGYVYAYEYVQLVRLLIIRLPYLIYIYTYVSLCLLPLLLSIYVFIVYRHYDSLVCFSLRVHICIPSYIPNYVFHYINLLLVPNLHPQLPPVLI